MSIKSKQIIFPVLVLFVFAAIAGGFMVNKKAPEKKPPKSNVSFVTTLITQNKPYQYQIISQGIIEPRHKTSIVAQAQGEIIQIFDAFAKGKIITKGTVLAKIDPFNYLVKLQQAKANLANARASFILERAQGQVAEAEWAKISQAAPSELGLRKPQQEQALAAVKAAEAGLKQAQKDLDRTTVIAPYDAIINSRDIALGSFVSIGKPIGQISNITSAEVRLPINQKDFAYLENQGLFATVNLSSLSNGKKQNWQAKITRSEGVVDINTRMIYLVAKITDPYQRLSSSETSHSLAFGSFATAIIQGRQLPQAFLVPRHLIRDNKIPVAIDNKLHFKAVVVSRNEGKHSVITQGLRNGDRIITSALDQPIEGMNIEWEGMPTPAIDEPDSRLGVQ